MKALVASLLSFAVTSLKAIFDARVRALMTEEIHHSVSHFLSITLFTHIKANNRSLERKMSEICLSSVNSSQVY